MMRRESKRNIVSVSWTDHLIFGEGDGRLAEPEALKRRMEKWRDVLNAETIHWRLHRIHIKGKFYAARGKRHPVPTSMYKIHWNDLGVVPKLAHAAGLEVYLYVSIFDEGWPLLPKRDRNRSCHNAMHGQHVAWQTDFSRKHPEYAVVDRCGKNRQWGVLCLAYSEVRNHFRERFLSILEAHDFDGLFICLRSQSQPAAFADQYGFNEPVRREYSEKYRIDICKEDFDLQAWRDMHGHYITRFLREMRAVLQPLQKRLAVGAPKGDVLGPPMSNATLQWRDWVEAGLIDELVINQISSRCPSRWHDLWPMQKGYGYVRNYLWGDNLPCLAENIGTAYAPVFTTHAAKLYIARQWDNPSHKEEAKLLALPAVTGLVFSSFRYDNPGVCANL